MASPPLSPVPYLAAGRLPEAKVRAAMTTGCALPQTTFQTAVASKAACCMLAAGGLCGRAGV